MCPIYEYRCQACEEITENYRTVDERHNAPGCKHCGGTTNKILSLGFKTHGDISPYYDENLESWVDSKQHRKRIMEEQGVEEAYGKGWR